MDSMGNVVTQFAALAGARVARVLYRVQCGDEEHEPSGSPERVED